MFNLYEILRNAQGGQAIDNLAAQFNITAEEADAAVKAIVPALSEGFSEADFTAAWVRFVRRRAGERASIWRLSPIRPQRKPLPRRKRVAK